MSDAAYYLAGVVAVLAGLVKLRHSRGKDSTAARYLSWVLICLGLGCLVLAPATLELGAGLELLPNLPRLAGNGLVIGGVYAMVGVLAHTAHPVEVARRRMRGQAVLLALVLATMTALLLSGRTGFAVDFVNADAGHPLVVAYEVVFLGYAARGTLGMLLLARTAAQHTAGFFRTGLRLSAAGAGCGLAWALFKVTMTLWRFVSGDAVVFEGPVSTLLSATSIALVVLGTTMTAWGPHAAHPLAWWRACRDLHRLRPLWEAVHAELPELTLAPPGGGVELQLYRRVVEIRDASLALRAYVHPAVPDWVAGECAAAGIPDADAIDVLTEAAALATALEAHHRGHRYRTESGPAAAPRDTDLRLATEVHHLCRISAAFTRSAVVSTARERIRADLAAESVSPGSRPG